MYKELLNERDIESNCEQMDASAGRCIGRQNLRAVSRFTILGPPSAENSTFGMKRFARDAFDI